MFHIRNSESQHFITFASETDFAIRFVEVLIMKKFLTALVLIIFATMPLFAQSRVVSNPVNKAFWGIRAGGNITCPGELADRDVFRKGGGMDFGVIYNGPVVANFYVELGLKFFYNTYSEKYGDSSIRKNGMRIPIMAGYHFDFSDSFRFYLFTGPVFEIGFSAKEVVKRYNWVTSNNLYSGFDRMERLGLLWGAGAGFSIRHIYVGASANIGLTNKLDMSNRAKFYENYVAISLGYNF